MNKLRKMLKRFISEEKNASKEYMDLIRDLKKVKAPKEIIDRISEIRQDEISHFRDVSDILEAIS